MNNWLSTQEYRNSNISAEVTGKGIQALSAAMYSASKKDSICTGIESFLYYTMTVVKLEEGKFVST
jgi:hypothetical protein